MQMQIRHKHKQRYTIYKAQDRKRRTVLRLLLYFFVCVNAVPLDSQLHTWEQTVLHRYPSRTLET